MIVLCDIRGANWLPLLLFINAWRQENYSKGVVVTTADNETSIDVYVVISYGVKISEVAKNIQERVKFNLENQLGITADTINVYIQNIKVVGE